LSTGASEQAVQHRSPAVGEWTLRGATGLLTAYAPVATLVILVLAVAAGNSNFLSVTNLLNMFSQWAPAGIIAAGMTYVVLTGGFDLSVAAAYSFTAVVAAVVGRSFDPAIAFASAVAAGVCFGIINGSLIAVVKLNPFITTVGTGFMLNGLALLLTDNAAISVDNPDFGWLGAAKTFGLPDSGLLLIGTYALLETILRRTTYGEAVYAVGGNYEASWLSGLPVRFVIASTYVLFGACCGLAGSITASQLQSAQANIDSGMIFDVLTIVVVGGTSLAGGSGSVWRTAIGLGIIATMSNGLVLLGISPYYQDIIKGMIIVAALAMSAALRRSR
jgi:ribose transport system permease protein